MQSNRVICPHCSHDGTMETSRPPLGSYGFNYLAEGVVCREVRGFDESGRLRLSGDFKCEGSQATNARIECRSCWRTFPVPEGLLWAVVPEQFAETTEGPEAAPVEAAGPEGLEAAAGAIGRSLVSALRSMVHEVEQAGALQIARLDADLATLRERTESEAVVHEEWRSRIAGVETALRAQETGQQEILDRAGALATQQQEVQRRVENQGLAIASLEQQAGELRQTAAAQQDALRERMETLDGGLRADREGAGQLRALFSQLQGEGQALQQRLDAQADVIRALHGAALEQTTRREELRAAVQRLEELTGSLGQVKPLPEQL